MRKLLLITLALILSPLAIGQTTPNLGLNIPGNNVPNWGTLLNENFSLLDTILANTAVTPGAYTNANITVNARGQVTAAANGTGGGSSGSSKVVYASTVSGATGGQAIAPGSSATGDTDSAAPLNAVLAAGNTRLVLDGTAGYALSTSLIEYSGDTIECPSRANGVIMMVASNATPIINAHQNAPTTASGTGGYLPSNITDQYLSVHGCTVNANSTQALTGTNSADTAHGATAGGLFGYGIFFLGVNHLSVYDNDVYDTGAFATFFSNTTDDYVFNNYIHQPTPTVARKFTDAVHFIGPDKFLWVQNNHLNAGDDTIALNADDGNRTGSGDSNGSYVIPAVKWGPITDAHIDNNTFDATSFGVRLYSATELVDRIFVTNTSGTACGNTAVVNALFALGSGNFGKIRFDGWTVQTDGSCNAFGVPYNFQVNASPRNLEIDGVSIINPGVNWPVYTETSSTAGIRSFHDWNLTTATSTFSDIFAFNGNTGDIISESGINWLDSVGTGAVNSGTAIPNTLTCSDYSGPNLLMATGFAPANENGDCFTNSYTNVTTYVNTSFNEQTSGAALAGTAPATCANGCAGTWTAASGGPSSGVWAYTTNSATITGVCTSGGPDDFCPVYMNAGVANYTLRVNATVTTNLGFVMRWTDNANFVTVLLNSGNATLYDVVGGTTTMIATLAGGGADAGTYTVKMNGTAVTVTTPSGSFSGTISGSNTSDNVGLNSNAATTTTNTISSFSVKSL